MHVMSNEGFKLLMRWIIDETRYSLNDLQNESERSRQSIIHRHIKSIVGRKVPYGRVKIQFTGVDGIYWDHMDEVAAEIKRHVEFGLNDRSELIVIKVKESFAELADLLHSAGISLPSDNTAEDIIESVMRIKGTYDLLESEG